MKHIFVVIALLLSLSSLADEPLCESTDSDCISVEQWQFSVAIGAGVLTNPLAGGDNIPLLVIPYVSYYRDHFFIENTTVGYTFIDQPLFDVSVIVEPNVEQAFFERFHLRNIIAPGASLSASDKIVDSSEGNIEAPGDELTSGITVPVSIDDISKRDWAIDSGLLGHWYVGQHNKVSFQWLSDISGTYKGQHAKIAYHHNISLFAHNAAKLQLIGGLQWKDKSLVDYYYGIDGDDNVDESLHYQGRSTITPFFGITLNYNINDDWVFKASVKQQFLGSGITDSPLIEKGDVTYFFIGGIYVF